MLETKPAAQYVSTSSTYQCLSLSMDTTTTSHKALQTPETESANETSRRAKKRATDRRAQREHRQRRNAYVRHLEESLKTLTEQHTSEDRIAALLKEQKRLKEKCLRLTTRLNRVKQLVTDNDESENEDPSSKDKPNQGAEDYDCNKISSKDTFSTIAVADSIDSLPLPKTARSSSIAVRDLPAFKNANEHFSPPSESSMAESFVTMRSIPTFDSIDHASKELASDQPSNMSLSLSHPLDHDLAYKSPPRYSTPTETSDKLLLKFIHEAQVEYYHGRFDVTEPTLRRIFLQPPHDILAFRLYHYITAAYGPMHLHSRLAIFWLQYLYLRWMVLGTRSAFERIPFFYRPSALERRIPHRFCISMLVWTNIRHALIRDAGTVDPEVIGAAIMKNLDPQWNGLDTSNTDLEVLETIEKQAEEWELWKVGKEFGEKYPQYADCVPVRT